jgi:hypothetical protein
MDAVIDASQLKAKYADVVDRESAYEKLAARLQAAPAAPAAPAPSPAAPSAPTTTRAPKPEPSLIEQVAGSSAFKSMVRSAGTVIGREITRSLFGTRRR